MPPKKWVLTDVDADIHQQQITLGPDQVGGPAQNYTVTKKTLHGGCREGVDVVEVDNGRMRFVVVPTRGMGIWRASCQNVSLGWQSPVRGPVHPAFVPLWEASGVGWLSGFDEFFVRGGLDSNGVPEFLPNGAVRYPLHGRVANIPAHKVEVTIDGETGEIAVQGVVDEARLYGNKFRLTTTIGTRVGSCEIAVLDEVQNLSAEPGELELLYHINIGMPLAGPGAVMVMPVKKLVPRDASAAADVARWNLSNPEQPGASTACHLMELLADSAGNTRVVVRSPTGQEGASVKFNKTQLPWFTLSKHWQAAADGHFAALEPATNFPNPKSFEKSKGRVIAMAPGETRRFEVSIEAHTDADLLAAAEKAVAAIQGRSTPEICTKPDSNWASS